MMPGVIFVWIVEDHLHEVCRRRLKSRQGTGEVHACMLDEKTNLSQYVRKLQIVMITWHNFESFAGECMQVG